MKYFRVPLYHRSVIILTWDEYLHKFPRDNDENSYAKTNLDGGDVWMTFKPKFLTPGAIAHECLHAVNLIFESAGVDATPVHDEHQAYLLEFIYQNVYDIMYPKKGSKK